MDAVITPSVSPLFEGEYTQRIFKLLHEKGASWIKQVQQQQTRRQYLWKTRLKYAVVSLR